MSQIVKHKCTCYFVECVGPADIIFALDSSDSLTHADFNQSKAFVSALLDNMLISPTNIRVRSVFSFSTNVLDIFDDLYNKPLMKILLAAAPMEKVGTRTDLAIEQAILRLNKAPAIPSNPKFAVIVTDGKSAKPGLTLTQAMAANAQGITILAVGIRNSRYTSTEWQTMEDELLRIANNITEHVLVATNFNEMMAILPKMNSLICTRKYT